MRILRFFSRTMFAASFPFAVSSWMTVQAEETHFEKQIRPILSNNCFSCHGPDAQSRQADLRLDQRESVLERKAIDLSALSESELLKRIESTDPTTVMPPPESSKTLSVDQKKRLRDWVMEGAAYAEHWSFIAPKKAPVPADVNPIDFFIERELSRNSLQAATAADPATFARRLSLDLVGLPPSHESVKKLTDDFSESAKREYIEQLLASQHFGERMAIPWLDVVRFADTIGYHSDTPRNIYPYRDYVIDAFNSNKPFDLFTIEQIAGDLLPDASQEQKVASGFNRLLLTTEEGGAQAKDYEARYMGDRVRAVGTTWLGLTIGCSQCHDHKFDPISSKDFYALGAFFADIDEPIIGKREDGLMVLTNAQRTTRQRLVVEESRLAAELAAEHPELSSAQEVWESKQVAIADAKSSWQPLRVRNAASANGSSLAIEDGQRVLASGTRPDMDTYSITLGAEQPLAGIVGIQLEAIPHPSLPSGGSGRAGNGNFVVTEIAAVVRRSDGTSMPLSLTLPKASFEQTVAAEANPYKKWNATSTIDRDEKGAGWGWAVLPNVASKQQLQFALSEPIQMASDDKLEIEMRQNHGAGGHLLGHFQWNVTTQPLAVQSLPVEPVTADLLAIVRIPGNKRSSEQSQQLRRAFYSVAAELEPLRSALTAARKSLADFDSAQPRTLISTSMATPRTVRILPRGNFLDETGEIVGPAIPAFLASNTQMQRKLSRLDLAQWIVSRDNPLTARVFVNRLWKQFFGVGLSRTLDDLGAQGEPPTHPELLDYLAVEFVESGWDIKRMIRLIVSSRSYQRASFATAESLAQDPENRMLARQGRFRLPAELVRDTALSIGGILNLTIGGPSAKPYQPENYWENLNFPQRTYQADQGPQQYRRGLYTWWQRSFVHPSMLAFDAPTREECAADRNQSNIPQQALVLMNDPTYTEAARAFAARIVVEGGPDTRSRIAWAFETAVSRPPNQTEVDLLARLHVNSLSQFQTTPNEAIKMFSASGGAPATESQAIENAAWVQVARAVLNLHEVITRN